jgi:signal transduction histidine kinase
VVETLNLITWISLTALILLLIYLFLLQSQIRAIHRQLEKRLNEKTRQPICLELLNHNLSELTSNINRSLKAEETLRLESIRREKQLKDLIANISHDLRTPLTAIRGYQQLLEKAPLTAEQKRKLTIAQKHAQDLGSLIDQFFEYSYFTSMETELLRERTNLTNLVTDCLVDSVAQFEAAHLTLSYEEKQPVFALVNQGLMRRIIQNIIRNCIQHSVGEIEADIHANKNAVIVFKNPVKNSDEIDIDRLFERYYTSDKARTKGTGLGLSIVKVLTEQMGGIVYAKLVNHQLEIYVEFPLAG